MQVTRLRPVHANQITGSGQTPICRKNTANTAKSPKKTDKPRLQARRPIRSIQEGENFMYMLLSRQKMQTRMAKEQISVVWILRATSKIVSACGSLQATGLQGRAASEKPREKR